MSCTLIVNVIAMVVCALLSLDRLFAMRQKVARTPTTALQVALVLFYFGMLCRAQSTPDPMMNGFQRFHTLIFFWCMQFQLSAALFVMRGEYARMCVRRHVLRALVPGVLYGAAYALWDDGLVGYNSLFVTLAEGIRFFFVVILWRTIFRGSFSSLQVSAMALFVTVVLTIAVRNASPGEPHTLANMISFLMIHALAAAAIVANEKCVKRMETWEIDVFTGCMALWATVPALLGEAPRIYKRGVGNQIGHMLAFGDLLNDHKAVETLVFASLCSVLRSFFLKEFTSMFHVMVSFGPILLSIGMRSSSDAGVVGMQVALVGFAFAVFVYMLDPINGDRRKDFSDDEFESLPIQKGLAEYVRQELSG